jgi:anti-sigma factor RsiW
MLFWIRMTENLHELSALYALDALTGDDRARFERHLEECDECRGQLAGLREAGTSLAFAVEGPPPPGELRARILDAARAEGQNVVPLRPRRSLAVSIAAAVAVAATAAAVAFGVWAASLPHSLSGERAAVRILSDPNARHVPVANPKGELVVAPSGQAVLNVSLPAPPKGKTYEAWVAAPSAKRAGEFDGHTVRLTQRVPDGARVMVTVERSGGVDRPTSSPLLIVRA